MTSRTSSSRPSSYLGLYLPGQFLLTLACAAGLLKLWRLDLRVPFNYWGDSIFELILVKSIIDGGWIWHVQRLGAPFGLDIAAFPQNLFFSSLIMKGIATFTREPGLVLNLFWILSIALTSVICNLAMRPLGLGKRSTLALSTLYALLPHAFYRNIAHVSLTYMFVPVVCAQALLVLSRIRSTDGTVREDRRLPMALLVFSGLAIGVDYVYTAFFSCFFLAVAGIAAFLISRKRQALVETMPLVALICIAALVNLSPSLFSWHQFGAPASIGYKGPAEAEFYGLKIRHLLSPAASDVLTPAAVVYPLENENAFARLGVVGGVGFVLALGAALFVRRDGDENKLWATGALAVSGLLLGTVGGFGAIFNLLVVPDIRAYNRISVFIAFFSFYALFSVVERVYSRFAAGRGRTPERLFAAGLCALFVIGVLDQGAAAKGLVRSYDRYHQQYMGEREFVARIERSAPMVTHVFQLPMVPFPGDPGRERMTTYDHGRPYLWSDRVRWSWPALSDAQVAFESRLQVNNPAALIPQLLSAGFDGIWIDRFGYQVENVEKLVREISSLVESPPLISMDGRYVFFDMSTEANAWFTVTSPAEQVRQRNEIVESVLVKYGKGFFGEERSEGARRIHRWSEKTSTLSFINPGRAPKHIEFAASVQGSTGAVLSVQRPNGVRHQVDLSSGQGDLLLSFDLEPTERVEMRLSLDGSRVVAPADPRSLYFALINPTSSTTESSRESSSTGLRAPP